MMILDSTRIKKTCSDFVQNLKSGWDPVVAASYALGACDTIALVCGPPGIGKSTVCKELGVVDLEQFYDPVSLIDASKFHLYVRTSGMSALRIYGAAAFNPNNVETLVDVLGFRVTRVVWILLDHTSQFDYDVQRAIRDKAFPAKKNQDGHYLADFAAGFMRDVKYGPVVDSKRRWRYHRLLLQDVGSFCSEGLLMRIVCEALF